MAAHTDRRDEHVVVVGGGITGLAAAANLLESGVSRVEVREAAPDLGGNIRTSPFHGLDAVDEGADAFLARVPAAVDLARRVGLGDSLVNPTGARAAVWYPRRRTTLHPIPEGVLLGVPTDLRPFITSRLLGVGGRARAALDAVLPRTPTTADSVGGYVRARLGDQVHERLVDALVGSIYAADTDRMSLRSVPQLAALAERSRSMVLGARRARRTAPPTSGPIFATPAAGMGALVEAVAARVRALGGTITTATPVERVERAGSGWSVDGTPADRVVLACPAAASARLVTDSAPEAARLLATAETAGVVIVTVAVPGDRWPDRLRDRSGYLVPKPVQGAVTAVSFGSQKWAHWDPPDHSQVLRISLGRDGADVSHLDDDAVLGRAVAEVDRHLEMRLEPLAVRISRWPTAFPQYRPGHLDWVDAVEAALPAGLSVMGASYRGIGIPACIASAHHPHPTPEL